MTTELGCGTERNPEIPNELRGRSKCVTFRDIRRDRQRGAAHLIDEGKVPGQGGISRKAVCQFRELVSSSPSVQRLQLSHARKVRVARPSMCTHLLRLTAFLHATFPVSRFPFPVSRV